MGHDRGKEVRSMAWIALSAFLILLLTAPVRAVATFVVEKDVQFGFGIRVGWFHFLRCGIVRRVAAGRYEAVLFDENDRPCGRRPLFSQKRNSDQIKREKKAALLTFFRALRLREAELYGQWNGTDAARSAVLFAAGSALFAAADAYLQTTGVRGKTNTAVRLCEGERALIAECMVCASVGNLSKAAVRAFFAYRRQRRTGGNGKWKSIRSKTSCAQRLRTSNP